MKKIYSDMADAGLPEAEYFEGPNTVRLILRNNIDERMPHRNKTSDKALSEGLNGGVSDVLPKDVWDQLDEVEKGIITFIKENGKASRAQLEKYTKKSRGTVIDRLNKLTNRKLIKVNGDIHNPKRTYELM